MALTDYLLGQHLTAVTITQIVVDANGNGTLQTPQDLEAFIFSVTPNQRRVTEDIRPIWRTQENYVTTGVGDYLRLVCLQRSSSANILRQLASATHAQVAWAQGAETFTGDYTVQNWDGGIQNRGANYCSLDLQPADFNAAAQVVVT